MVPAYVLISPVVSHSTIYSEQYKPCINLILLMARYAYQKLIFAINVVECDIYIYTYTYTHIYIYKHTYLYIYIYTDELHLWNMDIKTCWGDDILKGRPGFFQVVKMWTNEKVHHWTTHTFPLLWTTSKKAMKQVWWKNMVVYVMFQYCAFPIN